MKAPQLLEFAESLGVHEGVARARKQDVIFNVLKAHARSGGGIWAEGVLEILQDGFGFLRSADESYLAGPDDIYVRSDEHTSELQSLMRISYAVFCLKEKHTPTRTNT